MLLHSLLSRVPVHTEFNFCFAGISSYCTYGSLLWSRRVWFFFIVVVVKKLRESACHNGGICSATQGTNAHRSSGAREPFFETDREVSTRTNRRDTYSCFRAAAFEKNCRKCEDFKKKISFIIIRLKTYIFYTPISDRRHECRAR